ncbi:hypothetical protein STEG23_035907, partial [Scotinomys teguina]
MQGRPISVGPPMKGRRPWGPDPGTDSRPLDAKARGSLFVIFTGTCGRSATLVVRWLSAQAQEVDSFMGGYIK